MIRMILPAALCAALCPASAFAHAVCGDRIFPVTLTMDDPGVADEASLPTALWQRSPGPLNTYNTNFEYDKRITTNLGVAINYGWTVLDANHSRLKTGFSNVVLTGKYSRCLDARHEFVLAGGMQREFGQSGTQRIGADPYGGTTPTVYAGKGFGDIGVGWLRPFAITGELSYTVADRRLKTTANVDPDSGNISYDFNNGNSNRWFGAMSLQYSIPYLQAQVKDYGLPSFLSRLTPVVETTWTSAASKPSAQGTTWTVAPGVIYSSASYQLGVEALIPANRAAGSNVGVIAQFHIFLDDIFPNSIGRPIFQ